MYISYNVSHKKHSHKLFAFFDFIHTIVVGALSGVFAPRANFQFVAPIKNNEF